MQFICQAERERARWRALAAALRAVKRDQPPPQP